MPGYEVRILSPQPAYSTPAGDLVEMAVLRERVARLEDELVARRQSESELRALVSQAQSLQLRLIGGGSPGSLDGGP